MINFKFNNKKYGIHTKFIEYLSNIEYKDGIILKYYINNKLNGVNIRYYKNSNIWIKSYYKDNKKEGKCVKYYENGNIESECNYKNDKLNKECFGFNENGIINVKYNYKNGKLKRVKYYGNINMDTLLKSIEDE
jgi:antitoxin component YwqK of YwqJK toxin-antitoxin module